MTMSTTIYNNRQKRVIKVKRTCTIYIPSKRKKMSSKDFVNTIYFFLNSIRIFQLWTELTLIVFKKIVLRTFMQCLQKMLSDCSSHACLPCSGTINRLTVDDLLCWYTCILYADAVRTWFFLHMHNF